MIQYKKTTCHYAKILDNGTEIIVTNMIEAIGESAIKVQNIKLAANPINANWIASTEEEFNTNYTLASIHLHKTTFEK